ncbi:hypothetical protein, partial [Eubacterium ramulus]|uniref:hypothetical protein n=1 Tax=Eubacterium ramulus TaxID=39490 RepID=UPI001A9A3302
YSPLAEVGVSSQTEMNTIHFQQFCHFRFSTMFQQHKRLILQFMNINTLLCCQRMSLFKKMRFLTSGNQ